MVAAVFRTIFAQPDAAAVHATWDQVRDQLAERFPKLGPFMDDAKAEVLASPRSHVRTGPRSGPPTHSNGSTKEIKRRARVFGIFPNPAAVIRLVGAVLVRRSPTSTAEASLSRAPCRPRRPVYALARLPCHSEHQFAAGHHDLAGVK
jgi:transposase-like protein